MRDGWRVLMRSPGVVVAEIVWRWTFGGAMWWLLFVSFHAYFSTIEISPAEYQLMKSLEPYTWTAVAVRVMAAIITGLREMGPILIPALCALWIALATIGRAVTVRELAAEKPRTNWVALGGLHLFRVVMAFAAILAFFGVGAIVGTMFDPSNNFGLNFFLMFIAMAVLATIWSVVNWFLSVAAIFAARDGAGFWTSIFGAGDVYRASIGRASFVFSLMRAALVIGSTVISLIFAALLTQGHRRGPIVGIVLVTLIYFAVVDALYMWRLATYISVTEPEAVVPTLPPALPVESMPLDVMLNEGAGPSEVPRQSWDRDEIEKAPPPQDSERPDAENPAPDA